MSQVEKTMNDLDAMDLGKCEVLFTPSTSATFVTDRLALLC